MRTILVTYDLNRPGQEYGELIRHLKAYPSWWKHLYSTWLLRTPLTAEQVRDAVRQHLDVNDKLLVVDVTGAAFAWTGINAEGSNWIQTNYR
ncbi:MAG TPA: SinR family protein [Chloroflexota bacterium]|jgi:hypothetical protein|nr:SinR family protein [Chloroflexota bacterium]